MAASVLGFWARRSKRLALVLIAGVMFLAGCMDRQQLDAQKKEDQAAAKAAQRQTDSIDDVRCQSFGLKRGTPEYSRCRNDLDEQRSIFMGKD